MASNIVVSPAFTVFGSSPNQRTAAVPIKRSTSSRSSPPPSSRFGTSPNIDAHTVGSGSRSLQSFTPSLLSTSGCSSAASSKASSVTVGFQACEASAVKADQLPPRYRPRAGLLSRALSTDEVQELPHVSPADPDDEETRLGFYFEAASADEVLQPLQAAQVRRGSMKYQ